MKNYNKPTIPELKYAKNDDNNNNNNYNNPTIIIPHTLALVLVLSTRSALYFLVNYYNTLFQLVNQKHSVKHIHHALKVKLQLKKSLQ